MSRYVENLLGIVGSEVMNERGSNDTCRDGGSGITVTAGGRGGVGMVEEAAAGSIMLQYFYRIIAAALVVVSVTLLWQRYNGRSDDITVAAAWQHFSGGIIVVATS